MYIYVDFLIISHKIIILVSCAMIGTVGPPM